MSLIRYVNFTEDFLLTHPNSVVQEPEIEICSSMLDALNECVQVSSW